MFVETMKRREERHVEKGGKVDASTAVFVLDREIRFRKKLRTGNSILTRTSILSKAISPPLALVGLAARVLEQVDSELAIRRLVYLLKLGSCSKSDKIYVVRKKHALSPHAEQDSRFCET
jgi:hypothetical protein